MPERAEGFAPVFNENSKVLILGSFPSVKSRKISFYYGHPQNRFWKMLSTYFSTPMPETTEQKREFLLKNKVALWDSVQSCEIVGSKDDSITNYIPARIEEVLKRADIQLILLNGKRALSVFEENYKNCGVEYKLMPSTSPANPRYRFEPWKEALDGIFKAD
ncbi:MAG: DNA-deoxyinosine glycosylase [Clostridia bacterium]|nr:DNA-deoxyinosine glycosylase [Clostridia bacterium]